ncbi:MAG TPA: hypothetical protein VJR89_03630 [Polyangiales bacterium]|nr:hypothetical protein [Polyangiales bacterium]
MPSTLVPAALQFVVVLLLAACGGDDSAPAAPVAGAGAGGLAAGGGSAGRAGSTTPPPAGAASPAGMGAAGMSGAGAPAAAGGGGAGTGAAGAAAGAGGGAPAEQPKFSFFVTSVGAMQELSKNPMGFGGDLRFGKATGLDGADESCRRIADKALPGAGNKVWRAFLSSTAGPVHAKDRVGEGPWYDRLGRLVAMTKADLLQPRPRGADPLIINDLPNENGVPNHTDGAPGCTGNACPDNHQVLTGTNDKGMLYSTDPLSTCNDWTSSMPMGKPWCGHSWPRQGSGVNWMSSAADGGCAPCVSLMEMGGVKGQCVGSAGGYGGIYCLALTP